MASIHGNAKRFVSNTVETLTGKFFPHVSFSQLGDSSYGNEAVSNLPLQMALYFSALYFPCWLAGSVAILTVKYGHVSSVYQWVLVAIYVAIPLVELIRLYVGYIGNLEEKVPEVAGSWLLTLLLQLPLLLFLLLVPGTQPSPLEYSLNAVFLFLVLLELLFGYQAINTIAAHQARLYHTLLVMRTQQEG